MTAPVRPADARKLINDLLDRGYERSVAPLLESVSAEFQPGSRLYSLWERVEKLSRQLEGTGKRLTAELPLVRQLLDETERAMARRLSEMRAAAERAEKAGVQAGVGVAKYISLPAGLRISGHWNTPDAESLTRAIDYISSAPFRAQLAGFPEAIAEGAQRSLIRDFYDGIGPLQSARNVRRVLTELPRAAANNMLRTLQLTAMRDATAYTYMENERLIAYQIRIATLDQRPCAACLALHGTRLKVGERVDDHWQGRCTSIAVLKGAEDFWAIEPGDQWFARQSADYQRKILGKGGFDDYQAGEATLRDFVAGHRDSIYGNMVRQATLGEIRTGTQPDFRPTRLSRP